MNNVHEIKNNRKRIIKNENKFFVYGKKLKRTKYILYLVL